MTGKIDALKELYDRFSRGDLDGAAEVWTDDVVWEYRASGIPGSGRYEGRQAAIDAVQQTVGKWDKFELSADEFFEQGDTVVALGHIDAAKEDQSVRLPVVHIWRYRGEQIRRLGDHHRHPDNRKASRPRLTTTESHTAHRKTPGSTSRLSGQRLSPW